MNAVVLDTDDPNRGRRFTRQADGVVRVDRVTIDHGEPRDPAAYEIPSLWPQSLVDECRRIIDRGPRH